MRDLAFVLTILASLVLSACVAGQPAANSAVPAYDRAAFGGWDDADGDCLDTRAEQLAALSTVPVRMDRCRVVRGRWIDPYTGRTFLDAGEVDIDHVVPLHYAWMHGAASWSSGKRRSFANDPRNLFPVQARVNREKGADGPLDWLPPEEGFRCEYVLRFRRVSRAYGLTTTSDERRELEQLTARLCGV